MPIQIECQSCKAQFSVPEEHAGRRARCRGCGAQFQIPAPANGLFSTPTTGKLLRDSNVAEMLGELRRRGLHGVLSLVELHRYNVDSLADLVDLGEQVVEGLECYPTEMMTNEDGFALLKLLSEAFKRKADPTSSAESDSYYEPFELKGDRLGMTLSEFKSKYNREIPGHAQRAPFCSDLAHGQRIPELWIEPWHSAAGIVHARIDHPFEHNSPTLAGVRTEMMLYHFLDAKLYQVTALAPIEGHPMIADALRKKFGAPTRDLEQGRQLTWSRIASTLQLTRGVIRPPSPSYLRMFLDEVVAEAERRRTHRGDSDI